MSLSWNKPLPNKRIVKLRVNGSSRTVRNGEGERIVLNLVRDVTCALSVMMIGYAALAGGFTVRLMKGLAI